MRPHILTDFFASTASLSGIAERTGKALARLSIQRVRDLAFHLPSGILHYPLRSSLRESISGQNSALEVTVIEHVPKPTTRQPYKVVCVDLEGTPVHLVYFHAYSDTLIRLFPLNSKKLVAGTVEAFSGQYQIVHPDKVWPVQRVGSWCEVEPSYPLTAGISQAQMQKFVRHALEKLPSLPEWIPQTILQSQRWPCWTDALNKIHTPQGEKDLDLQTPARRRLAFDELLSHQIGMSLIRKMNQERVGKSRRAKGVMKKKILEAFGFTLTPSQAQVLEEIERDLNAEHPMTRLLQGDVGSGKTLVGLLAMAQVIESGDQAAMLVPTEVLAQQHFHTLSKIVDTVGLRTALLTGRIKGKARQKIYDSLQSGEIDLVIGTHALIQDPVKFHSLGLTVIDEQHRFGVEQRAKLTQKGKAVDILVMTATPIPRTLMLTSYGDLDVSRMLGKPEGRKDITTKVMSLQRLNEVYEGLKRIIDRGEQAYWVCPLVDESEALDLAAATERYQDLVNWFGEENVGLVHGQMNGAEKDAAMSAFTLGQTRILVSTTVIEVGVDVPQATVMIIEHAERFGLSQLHQLRGRVGRNQLNCSCLLLYGPAWSAATKARFQVMRETNDGFRIAEEDLKLRGGGDLLGTKQSGLPTYHFAELNVHLDLLQEAHQQSRKILENESNTLSEAIQILLYLFEHDKSAPLLKAAA